MDIAQPIATQLGAAIALGTNLDDLGDVRPGIAAARERGARMPLVDAGFTKADVRALSRELGLRTWDKPQLACLSSRFPYGTQITPDRLRRVDAFEDGLRGLGFRQLRVRFHDDQRPQIEHAELPGSRRCASRSSRSASARPPTWRLTSPVPLGCSTRCCPRGADPATRRSWASAGSRSPCQHRDHRERRGTAERPRRVAPVHQARRAAEARQAAGEAHEPHNSWTHEWLAPRRASADAADARRFRVTTTRTRRHDEPRLGEILVSATHFKSDRDQISAFRHRKHNLLLRKKATSRARQLPHARQRRRLQHPEGRHADVARLGARQKIGGVGRYLKSGLSMDTGPIRFWDGEELQSARGLSSPPCRWAWIGIAVLGLVVVV
jgi:hypothetical protein